MGMFDEVLVRCPSCEKEQTVQSKGGDCILALYDLNEAPADVLSDVNRHAPFECVACGCLFKVELKFLAIERRV